MIRRYSTHCPNCGRYNPPDIMLCETCWSLLRSDTRYRLSLPDRYAADRYGLLIRSIYSGVPIHKIFIPSFSHLWGSWDSFRENLDKYLDESIELVGQLSLF